MSKKLKKKILYLEEVFEIEVFVFCIQIHLSRKYLVFDLDSFFSEVFCILILLKEYFALFFLKYFVF